MSDNLKHITQLTLTDEQVVFLTNAASFAVVSMRKHQDVQDPTDWARALATGFRAIDQAPGETLVSTMIALQTASDEIVARGGARVSVHESMKPTPCPDCGEVHE
jgi:hypothetical protein